MTGIRSKWDLPLSYFSVPAQQLILPLYKGLLPLGPVFYCFVFVFRKESHGRILFFNSSANSTKVFRKKKALPKPSSIPDHAVSHKQKYPESSAVTTSALEITELLARASQHGLQSPP